MRTIIPRKVFFLPKKRACPQRTFMYERIVRHISLILRPVGWGLQRFDFITSHACMQFSGYVDMSARLTTRLTSLRREEEKEGK